MTLEITLAAFVISQIADVLTTFRFLKHGVREGNQIIRRLMNRTGKGWPFIKVAWSCGCAGLLVYLGYSWLVWVLTALVFAVALWNWRSVK